MENELHIIIDYLERIKNKPLGTSDLVGLIEMVNEKEEITNELFDNKYKNNLLCFLDGGLMELLKNKNNKQDVYNSIITVLATWENLPNKWEISGQEFRNLFKEKEI